MTFIGERPIFLYISWKHLVFGQIEKIQILHVTIISYLWSLYRFLSMLCGFSIRSRFAHRCDHNDEK